MQSECERERETPSTAKIPLAWRGPLNTRADLESNALTHALPSVHMQAI